MLKRQAQFLKRRKLAGKRKDKGGTSGDAAASNTQPPEQQQQQQQGASSENTGPSTNSVLARLPRGVSVRATVQIPPDWSPGDPVTRPFLLSFRRRLSERPLPPPGAAVAAASAPGGAGVGQPSAVVAAAAPSLPEGCRAEDKLAGALADIGKRDHLSDVIRSMENRLARQGVLAAPASILGGLKRSRSKADGENFYDRDDGFIDDEALEELNACDEQNSTGVKKTASGKRAGGGKKACVGLDSSAAGGKESQSRAASSVQGASRGEDAPNENVDPDDSDSDEDGSEGEAPQCDLAAFRLTGPQVSGTSGESCSEDEADSDGADDEGGAGEARPWRGQLEALPNEVSWVVAATGSKVSPSPNSEADAASAASAADAAIAELRNAFEECCVAIEKAAGQGLRGMLQDTVEAALPALLRRLPALARPAPWQPGGPALRPRLIALEPSATQPAAAGAAAQGLFAWSDAEEYAWARFTWRLVRDAAPEIRYASFVHHWTDAAREPQRNLMSNARAVVAQRMKEVYVGQVKSSLENAVKEWAKTSWLAALQGLAAMLRPLEDVLRALHVCWSRQRFWEDQRKLRRLRAPRQDEELALHLVKPFAVYAASQLSSQLALAVPVDMLCMLLRQRAGGASERPHIRSCQGVAAATVRLPLPIRMTVGQEVVDCTLKAVRSLDEQIVVIGSGPQARECRSLADASRSILAQVRRRRGKPETWPQNHVRLLRHKQGCWKLFQYKVSRVKTMPLSWLLNFAHNRRVAPFTNPADARFVCPPLPFDSSALKKAQEAAASPAKGKPLARAAGSSGSAPQGQRSQGPAKAAPQRRPAPAAAIRPPGAALAAAGQKGGASSGNASTVSGGAAGGAGGASGSVLRIQLKKPGGGAAGAAAAANSTGAAAQTAPGSKAASACTAGAGASSSAAAEGGGGGGGGASGQLVPGTSVKYLDGNNWWRATVKEDRGEHVVVLTSTGSGSKRPQIIARSKIQILAQAQQRPRPAATPPRSGLVIAVQDDSD